MQGTRVVSLELGLFIGMEAAELKNILRCGWVHAQPAQQGWKDTVKEEAVELKETSRRW